MTHFVRKSRVIKISILQCQLHPSKTDPSRMEICQNGYEILVPSGQKFLISLRGMMKFRKRLAEFVVTLNIPYCGVQPRFISRRFFSQEELSPPLKGALILSLVATQNSVEASILFGMLNCIDLRLRNLFPGIKIPEIKVKLWSSSVQSWDLYDKV